MQGGMSRFCWIPDAEWVPPTETPACLIRNSKREISSALFFACLRFLSRSCWVTKKRRMFQRLIFRATWWILHPKMASENTAPSGCVNRDSVPSNQVLTWSETTFRQKVIRSRSQCAGSYGTCLWAMAKRAESRTCGILPWPSCLPAGRFAPLFYQEKK